MPNRLADETSPYLLQHANNPVDWYPWGDEAFAAARRRDVPILLSVGYSSCHWCHVMERESFENPRIAAMMNAGFVNIKVDREERPDVDSVYMTAIQAMSGHGGWPMTVFMTADGEPFYGGTYFPPEDRGGMPAFDRVLAAISDAFANRRLEALSAGRRLAEHVRRSFDAERGAEPLTDAVFHAAMSGLASQFDGVSGGFGLQPKFPQPATLDFLLRRYARTGDPTPLEMAELTLNKMAAGGIHDQIGGGFHRYSTDAFWLVPHFEKMLYDNALLASLYARAWQLTARAEYRQAAQGVGDYLLREMASPDGGFYAAQDADSEGVEGKFFVWRPEQLADVLGKEDAAVVCDYFGVTREGNFEGMSILHVPRAADEVAARHSMTARELAALIASAKPKLLAARARRVPPMTDTKTITAWNGLAMAALAEMAAAFGRRDYLDAARANAAFLLERMVENGRLRRTDGESDNGGKGFLDDYAALIHGLLTLHRADGDTALLLEAERLARRAVALFWDAAGERFYDTGGDQETLIARPRDVTDNALPSGHSMMADALLRLAAITGEIDLRAMAASSLRSARPVMVQFPTAAGNWLNALDAYLSDSREVAIIAGDDGGDGADAQPMLSRLGREYLGSAVVVSKTERSPAGASWPIFANRHAIDGRATAYVCQNYACRLPTTDADRMMAELAGLG